MEQKEGHASASERVFQAMLASITQGEWSPTQKIPSENSLAQQYGVSRMTVRSAIQRLSSLGLLESRQGGGTFVQDLEPQPRRAELPRFSLSYADRVNIFEFRRAIETGAAELAASRAGGDVARRLLDLSGRMERAKTPAEIIQYDWEFHWLISEATGNPIFQSVFYVLCGTYWSLLKDNVEAIGSAGSSYHFMIAHAIQNRDPRTARDLMLRHLDIAMADALEAEEPEQTVQYQKEAK